MNILILLLLVASGVVFWKREAAPAIMQPLLLVLVLVALVLGVMNLRGRGGVTSSEKHEMTLMGEAAGYQMGALVASSVEGPGDVLVLHDSLLNDVVRRVMTAQMDGVKKALSTTSLSMVPIAMVPGPGEDASDVEVVYEASTVTWAKLGQFLQEYPNTKAIVSLMGNPDLVEGHRLSKMPPLYVVNANESEGLTESLDRGYVRAAVVHLRDVNYDVEPTSKMSTQEVFDMRFKLID